MSMSNAEFQNYMRIRAAHSLLCLSMNLCTDDLEKRNEYDVLARNLLGDALNSME